jgi:hypothetical protein
MGNKQGITVSRDTINPVGLEWGVSKESLYSEAPLTQSIHNEEPPLWFQAF